MSSAEFWNHTLDDVFSAQRNRYQSTERDHRETKNLYGLVNTGSACCVSQGKRQLLNL